MQDFIDRPVPRDQRIDRLVQAFTNEFGRRPEGIADAPGRVNLIGEHVDYNDGLVLPFAIDRSVMVAWAGRDDDAIWAYAIGRDQRSRFTLANITHAAQGSWENYVRGVAAVLSREHLPGGLDIAITGDVPEGSGLSSSAALEVAVAGAFRDAHDLSLSDLGLAQACQAAENDFVGVQCGIMDQFAAMLADRECALLVDCRSLAHESVPLRIAGAGLSTAIVNSAAPRKLSASAYNDRRRECGEAILSLGKRLARPGLASLRDVTLADLEDVDIDTVQLRRARHVVSEIARVAAAVEALERDEFVGLGTLMVESHRSLRDDYEVSSPELDLLVGLATAQDYAHGARLTGAGFGGCTVNLVQTDALEAFSRDVVMPYRERTGLAAVIYVTLPQDGLHCWRL